VADEDWMLMQRIAAGDEAAMATLYDRFGALVYKAARQVLSSRAEADDAVQDVFIRLWRTADKFDPRRAKLVTWVMLITRRNLIDRLRRKVSRIDTLPLAGDPGVTDRGGRPGETGLDEDQRAKLRERLRELPEIQRTVIERTYFQGYSLREVSEQLNAPLGTVKSALSRGLHRLRDRFGGDRAHG
jgi:RNA polymerase sigma-70 factor (ECF subfamily)